jgi:ribose transport system substrate-binding protein
METHMRKYFTVLSMTFILVFAASCGQEESDDDRITISVIPKGTSHVFWQSIHAGAVKAAKELNIEVLWVGTATEDDRQQQIMLVDNQVINQVDGIVLAPSDDVAFLRPVKDALRKGIPVIVIDSELKNSDDLLTSFVATDNYKGGFIAGTKLCESLSGKGNVIMLRYAEGSASTEKREAGFMEAVKAFPEINVVSEEQRGGATKASAQTAAENLLLRFKDPDGNLTIDGIYCVNESTTYGMLQALRRQRFAGEVQFIGFDSAEPLLEAMRNDEIHGLIVQNPFKMGYESVTAMAKHLKSESVAKRIDTGVTFVTKPDLDLPEMKELLSPDIEKWLNQP